MPENDGMLAGLKARIEEIAHERMTLEVAIQNAQSQIQQWVSKHTQLVGAEQELQTFIERFSPKEKTNLVPFPPSDADGSE